MGGGTVGSLPKEKRVGSVLSVLILGYFVYYGLAYNDVFFQSEGYDISRYLIVGYFFVGIIMHLLTKSKKERNLWLPIIIISFISSLFVFKFL